MNFLRQGFRKLLSDRQTYIHTDDRQTGRHDRIICHAVSQQNIMSVCVGLYNYQLYFTKGGVYSLT